MRTIIILIFLFTIGCKHNNTATSDIVDLKSDTTIKTETEKVESPKLTIQQYNSSIHGVLNKYQIKQYYPNILDTIKDLRIIASDSIDLKTGSNICVSMLHNAGTFDQMFLCTHDKNLKLIDCYYIGKSTTFDRNSHTIEFQKTGDNSLEFIHVNWGYVKRNGENEIDTLNFRKYILTVTQTGRIIKK